MNEDESFEESSFGTYQTHNKNNSCWKARFIVGLVMILGSFIGLILSHIGTSFVWDFWRISIAVFTVLSFGLCYYVRKNKENHHQLKLWQEIFLWLPLYLAGGIFSLFVYMQTMSDFQASLALLTSLSIVLMIAGALIEPSFIFTSISMALFAAGSAYLNTYLYKALLPIALVSIIALFFFAYLKRK